MKLSVQLIGLASLTSAFPWIGEELANKAEKRQTFPDPSTRFVASEQFVPTTGQYKWVAPNYAAGDVRGPCPGLNALANHGYLPHNGVATHDQFINATLRVFGMGVDLSGFLTILGGVLDGDGTKWSIGGPSKYVPAPLPGLGTPQGISGSHNKYENDVSPGRGDLYTHGDDYKLQMDQYTQLYLLGLANGDRIDLPVLTNFRSLRFDDSVRKNAYFFNGPFTGLEVQPAAFTFIYRFFGNKSAQYPQGILTTSVLNSFFGVTKNKDGSLTKQDGYERIPDNWYKRAVGDEYTIPFFQGDLLLAAQKYPKFLSVGGNTGKVNTFTGVDISNLTGGVYNAQSLTQPNGVACFSSQFLTQFTPDLIRCSGVISDVTSAITQLTGAINKAFGQFNCPAIEKLDDSQFSKFPGYTKLNCKTGKYP